MIIWSSFWVVARAYRCLEYFGGGWLPALFGLSGLLAVVTTCVAMKRGRLDKSWQGALIPVLHFAPLGFLASGNGPEWAAWLWLALSVVQWGLRLAMGFCCTVSAPVFYKILSRGPYAYIRHPLAVCELLLLLVFVVRYSSAWNWAWLVVASSCSVVAVLVEERFLNSEASYLEYQRQVKWRMLPGVW